MILFASEYSFQQTTFMFALKWAFQSPELLTETDSARQTLLPYINLHGFQTIISSLRQNFCVVQSLSAAAKSKSIPSQYLQIGTNAGAKRADGVPTVPPLAFECSASRQWSHQSATVYMLIY